MFHNNRTWNIIKVSSMDELAKKLFEDTWDTCTGFDLDDVLYLNDSTCPDGAQEYATVVREGDAYFQIESTTFSWLKDINLAWGAINELQEQYKLKNYNFHLPVEVTLDRA